MENLTNEQIIDIIKFYEKCGVAEETYLSKDGALDLFTLLKIKPEFDEDGNRKLTPYELLEVLPKFEGGHEVPIVFAIKRKANKVAHGGAVSGEFTFAGARKSDAMDILNKFKQDYFNAMSVGNISEASRVFNLVDKLTGGHAEEYIGINYNYEMFYAKMKRQLLIDLFANFLILRIMNKKSQVKEGIVKADKLYKEFVETKQTELASAGFGDVAPVLEDVSIVITEESDEDEEEKKIEFSSEKLNVSVAKQTQEVVKQNTISENIESFIKDKIERKIKNIRRNFENLSDKEEQKEDETKDSGLKILGTEKHAAVLESD